MNTTPMGTPVVTRELSIVAEVADALSEAVLKSGCPEEMLSAHVTIEPDEREVIKLVIQIFVDKDEILL